MELFNRLKSIEHSVVRWSFEEEFVTHTDQHKPLEELSFLSEFLPISPDKIRTDRLRLFRNDEHFPESLKRLFDPPWSISIQGTIPNWQNTRWLSVVGSREPLLESYEWMDVNLSEFLTHLPCGIISGGARGVDRRAHIIAMREKNPTLVLLPSGLDQIYPGNLMNDRQNWMARGATFISEYADDQIMRKYLFSHRNRLIAALAPATLVVQASEKSGTLMTGHRALELGRDVFVLPAHPRHRAFAGNIELLRAGAQVVSCAQDLINYFVEKEKNK